MQFIVTEGCIGCGLCADACPEIFSMTDDGVAVASSGEVDAELEASASEAMDGCPVQAIEQI